MVTLCIQNDTTETDFFPIKSKKMLVFRPMRQFVNNLSGVIVFNGRSKKRAGGSIRVSAVRHCKFRIQKATSSSIYGHLRIYMYSPAGILALKALA